MGPVNVRPSPAALLLPIAERVVVGLLCLGAAAGPIALGATGPWTRLGLETLIAIAATLWAVSGTRDPRRLLLPLAVAGLFFFQLLPLPDSMLANLAPVSAGRWKVAREGMAAAWAPISVDPAATAAAIRRLLLGLATIAAVADLGRTPTYRRWLYTALAASAGLVWAAGIAFPVNPENRAVMGIFSLRGPIDFWKTPERGPLQTSGFSYLDWVTVGDQRYQADGAINGDGFGSYIYSNHFANALCLTLPFAWALWMMMSARRKLPNAVRFGVLLVAMAAACWATGGMAHSRAGTASLAFAAIVYVALITQSHWVRWLAGCTAASIALGLIVFVAVFQGPLAGVLGLLPGALREQLAPVLADARIVAAQMAGKMFLASPLLGTGFGSYGDLYAVLQRSDHTLYFAHNDYAQLLAECGLLGCGLLGAAAWGFGRRFRRFCQTRAPNNRTIDAAAWAAVAGAAAHSVFDWNMHAPANAFLACIVAGLAFSSVAISAAGKPSPQPPWARPAATALLVAGCLAVMPLLSRDAFTADTLDALRRANTAARLTAFKPDAPPAAPKLTAAIARGERAARLDPGNWQLAAFLGQANLHLSNITENAAGRNSLRQVSNDWFRKARRSSAVTRGLAEPVTPSAP